MELQHSHVYTCVQCQIKHNTTSTLVEVSVGLIITYVRTYVCTVCDYTVSVLLHIHRVIQQFYTMLCMRCTLHLQSGCNDSNKIDTSRS